MPCSNEARRKSSDVRAYVQRMRDISAPDLALMFPPQPAPPKFENATAERAFEECLRQRMIAYREDGLTALRELAMMPVSPNAMQNQVKFMAATRLLGTQSADAPQGGTLEEELKRMNEAYKDSAPRIKEIRERIIVMEGEPKVINGG